MRMENEEDNRCPKNEEKKIEYAIAELIMW